MRKRMMGKIKRIVAVAMMACMLLTMTNVSSDAGNVSSDAGIMLCGEGLGSDWLELQ